MDLIINKTTQKAPALAVRSWLALAAVTLFLTFGQSAKAGILLEPFLGYETGDIKANNGNDTDAYSGFNYGLRFGYSSMVGLMVGAEYSLGKHDLKDEESTTDKDLKVDSSDLGFFVGFEIPLGFRAYATFLLDSEQDVDSWNNDPDGSGGIKLGIGVTAIANLAIHLEYISRKTERDSGTGTTRYETNTYGLSVSFPLSL